ncbi:GTP-binding protein 10 homolog [Centruroides sculpturatus]|uniref:GTP-binding protein 10 homolog n=1 Tax=Centruroides sculpturatus TaxID=218467 RepID=UPI000C6C97A3|nr:GTP-binding protein 10 homolog [Centruroides sculpturatus]
MDTENSEKEFAFLLEKLKHFEECAEDFPPEIRPSKMMEFDDVVPISATKAYNVEKLKQRIRTLLDFHLEKERESDGKDPLDLYKEETRALKLV